MGSRLDLQDLLESLVPHVYFQPPSSVEMQYPCIVYNRDNGDTAFAGNKPYKYTQRYSVTVIDTNPDSLIIDKVKMLPQCIYNRSFVADNLNHDVFVIYF